MIIVIINGVLYSLLTSPLRCALLWVPFFLAPCQVINSTGLQYTLPVFVKGSPGDLFGNNYSLSPGCTPGLCYSSSDGTAFWGFLIAIIDLESLSTFRYACTRPPEP